MHKANTFWSALLVLCAMVVAIPAAAQFTIGGHDETSESLPALWATGTPTPGASVLGGTAPHLLISEIVVTPTAAEYIEICNPTADPVDLTNYYLSDDWFTGAAPPSCYCRVVAQAGYGIGINSDFNARFPAGSIIPPGGVVTIAADGAGFQTSYGAPATFELNPTSPSPDMIIVSGNTPLSLALLTNTSEMVMLYFWDGSSDLVCDVDYVQWGVAASGNAVDKTGLAFDGPDADAFTSAYLADTAPGSQTFAAAPGAGSSVARLRCEEAVERTPGNGCMQILTPVKTTTWGKLKSIYR